MKTILITISIIICYTTADCQAIKQKIDTSIGYLDSNGNITYYVAQESYFKVDSTGKTTNILKDTYFDSIYSKNKVIHKKKPKVSNDSK